MTPTPLPAGWEGEILAGLGAPVVPSNVATEDAWQAAEGGSTANPDAFNPFNTTRNTDVAGRPLGGVPTNSVGVLAFPSWEAGMAATVATLEQPNMAGIRADLLAGAPTPTTEAAIAASPWGTKTFPPTTAGGGATLAASFPGGVLDPLNWPGDVAGSVGALARSLYATVVKGGVVMLGAGLVILAGVVLAREHSPGGGQGMSPEQALPLAAALA